MYLASGNLLESLATYDFKNESPWSDVNSETNPLKKFQLYKAKETPKFERAKLIDFANNIFCFISGTAAIRGEYSTHIQSPQKQTELTLDNIEYLISLKNLQYNSCPDTSLKICNLRVYIKNRNHYQVIRKTVETRFPLIPAIYLFTDICREELLVEIEGICQLSQ